MDATESGLVELSREEAERRHRLGRAALDGIVPLVLPADWGERACTTLGGRMWISTDGLRVIASIQTEKDGHKWLHVSLSRHKKLPSYFDLTRVKDLFVGRDRKAVQVFPAQSEHVNIMPYCLHLFCCLDGDPLPDFRIGSAL